MISSGFILTLVGLAGDTGFLHTIESAGSRVLSEPSAQIVANATGQIPAAAQAPARPTLWPLRDRPPRHRAASHAERRSAASRHAVEPLAVLPGSALQPGLRIGHPSAVPPVVAASRSQERSRFRRLTRPAVARHPTTRPVEAQPLPVTTLFAGGPALAAASGIASGAAAVVLATMLVLQILQLLPARLSLELVPWRSALLTLRLERPG
ncbi:MAG: hypothetical protein ACXVFQ_20085 [Solirubrobacteraceae bacterium]